MSGVTAPTKKSFGVGQRFTDFASAVPALAAWQRYYNYDRFSLALPGRSAAGKGQGEALIVVRGLPDSKRSSGRLEVGEAVPAPELLLIDAVAPLDFAVLLRAPGPDPSGFDPQHE